MATSANRSSTENPPILPNPAVLLATELDVVGFCSQRQSRVSKKIRIIEECIRDGIVCFD